MSPSNVGSSKLSTLCLLEHESAEVISLFCLINKILKIQKFSLQLLPGLEELNMLDSTTVQFKLFIVLRACLYCSTATSTEKNLFSLGERSMLIEHLHFTSTFFTSL